MNEFTASNGIRITVGEPTDHHTLTVVGLGLLGRSVDALREFFRAEEDERLGRWRSAKDPAWTAVVQAGSGVIFFRHEDGEREFSVDSSNASVARWHRDLQAIAHEYRDAHPESKPWHDAKPGEAWSVVVDGLGMALTVDSHGEFQGLVTRNPKSPSITAGRRIWPEDAS